MFSSSTSTSDPLLLPRLAHAISLISTTNPRTIPSPSTQPRRASVALLIRIKPNDQDSIRLAKCYDSEGMPIKGSEVDVDYTNNPTSSEGAAQVTDQQNQDGSLKGSGIGQEEEELIKKQELERNQLGERSGLGESEASLLDLGKSGISITNTEASFIEKPMENSNVDIGQDQLVDLNQSQSSTSSRPNPISTSQPPLNSATPYSRFFSQSWVQNGTPELLFIKRSSRPGDSWSSHVAFPGGRREESDENGLYTAMRETWEEVGIDLAEKDFLPVGALDDREITTSLGKRLLMVLSPYGEFMKLLRGS